MSRDGLESATLALAVSAVPVAVQLLKDAGWFRTSDGALILTVAVACDLIAWIGLMLLLSDPSVRARWAGGMGRS